MVIPEVLNTLLMAAILIVILMTIIRPLVLNLVRGYAAESSGESAVIEAIESEVAQLFEKIERQRTKQLEFQRQLLLLPEKPQPKLLTAPPAQEDDEDEDLIALMPPKPPAEPDPAESQETSEVQDGTDGQGESMQAQGDQSETTAMDEEGLADGEIEIREGESLAEIKERMKREKQSAQKPTIPPELLNNAKSYEDKVGVVRMVVQQDHSRVAAVIRSMIQTK